MTTTATLKPATRTPKPAAAPKIETAPAPRWVADSFAHTAADGTLTGKARPKSRFTKAERQARADHYVLLMEAEAETFAKSDDSIAFLAALARLVDDYRGGLPIK